MIKKLLSEIVFSPKEGRPSFYFFAPLNRHLLFLIADFLCQQENDGRGQEGEEKYSIQFSWELGFIKNDGEYSLSSFFIRAYIVACYSVSAASIFFHNDDKDDYFPLSFYATYFLLSP